MTKVWRALVVPVVFGCSVCMASFCLAQAPSGLAGAPQTGSAFADEETFATGGAQVWKVPTASTTRIDVLEIKDMDINDVFKMLSARTGLNIISGKSVQGRVTIFLKDIDVHDALAVILKSNGLAYEESRGVIEIMTAEEYQQKNGLRFGVEISTEVFDISYGKAEDIVRTIAPVLTRDVGHVEFDAGFNRIIVTDVLPKIVEVKRLVASMDRKQKQVIMEVKIIQVDLNKDIEMGLNWDDILSYKGRPRAQFNSPFGVSGTTVGGVSGVKSFVGTIGSGDFQVTLNMIESKGKTRVVSNPRIAAVNNQEAKIHIGVTQPYVTSSQTTPSTGSPVTAESVSFIDVGVKLNVTPTIHDDGFVTMKIRPEISTADDNITASSGNKIPIVKTSQVETTVRVKDGVTIIIGGLIKDADLDVRNKVPFLGGIPLIGKAFRSSVKTASKTEIVIFLTPHIIDGDINVDPDKYFTIKGDKDYADPVDNTKR